MSVATFDAQRQDGCTLSRLITTAAKILDAPPQRNAGQWADEHRILPPESPEPGPWRTDRVPFWRAIYEAFADADHDTVVVVCGAQMSKTEGLFNVIGWRFTDGPYVPAMYVGPTEKQVKSVSKDRIDKMLRSTPVLWERTAKGQDYGIYEKYIAGVRLGFAWAGSATELSSHPVGLVLVDERDRMDADTGHEGDPLELARARAKNYANRKIGVFSTPTIDGASPIWTLWEEGTMAMWAWPCLSCGTYFVPHLALLKWPKDVSPDEASAAARVICPKCGREHASREKAQLNALGAYLRFRRLERNERDDRAVFGQYTQDATPGPRNTASFWISGLASPWVTFQQVAKVLIDAYRAGEPERLQAAINTWGGELFRMSGEAPTSDEVAANKGEYPPRHLVPGVQKITLGADVQRDGIYFVIRGWGHNMESWLLEDGYLAGETEHEAVWLALRTTISAAVQGRPIDRAFIDSGYRPGDVSRRPDHAVYTFCRSFPGQVYPTKGWDSLETPYKFRSIDYTRGGVVIKGGVKLVNLDSDYFKRWLHARIRWPQGQPGAWHLHRETGEDYCRQMVSEELVLKASGRAKWIRRSRQNHFLDAEVNATAAALSINVHKLPPYNPPPSQPAAASHPGSSDPKPSAGYARRTLY
jgi:phage terminase large subunit GpA-like protein